MRQEDRLTEKDIREDSASTLLSASQLLPLVRRRIYFGFVQGAAAIGMPYFRV